MRHRFTTKRERERERDRGEAGREGVEPTTKPRTYHLGGIGVDRGQELPVLVFLVGLILAEAAVDIVPEILRDIARSVDHLEHPDPREAQQLRVLEHKACSEGEQAAG